jgi:hypothetical protein
MTMRDTLESAMHRTGGKDVFAELEKSGVFVVDENTMAGAVHAVYCSVMDHQEPNEKDRAQARALIESIRGTTPA